MKAIPHFTTFDLEGVRFDPEIYLEAEDDLDREKLDRILAECVTKGHGRHVDTGKLLHVRVSLQPMETP